MSSTLSDAMVLAMTPDEQCVGVRIFPKGYRQNGFTYKQFLANGTTAAAKLQTAIERGEIETSGDVAPHPSIIPSPPIRCSDVAVLMESKRDYKRYVQHMDMENTVICLGYQLRLATQQDHLQLDMCQIVLAEMNSLFEADAAPLILKKHPQIVESVMQLARYENKEQFEAGLNVQHSAKRTLSNIQKILGYNPARNGTFATWFSHLLAFFNEATVTLSSDERLQLTTDPTNTFKTIETFADGSSITMKSEPISKPWGQDGEHRSSSTETR